MTNFNPGINRDKLRKVVEDMRKGPDARIVHDPDKLTDKIADKVLEELRRPTNSGS